MSDWDPCMQSFHASIHSRQQKMSVKILSESTANSVGSASSSTIFDILSSHSKSPRIQSRSTIPSLVGMNNRLPCDHDQDGDADDGQITPIPLGD